MVLIFLIFTRIPAHFVSRILGTIKYHLLFHRSVKIDIELVGQPYQINQHIGYLMTDLFQLGGAQLLAAVALQPFCKSPVKMRMSSKILFKIFSTPF